MCQWSVQANSSHNNMPKAISFLDGLAARGSFPLNYIYTLMFLYLSRDWILKLFLKFDFKKNLMFRFLCKLVCGIHQNNSINIYEFWSNLRSRDIKYAKPKFYRKEELITHANLSSIIHKKIFMSLLKSSWCNLVLFKS